MKNLTASSPLTSGPPISRFNAARAVAITLAEADKEVLEAELIASIDRCTSIASTVLEGCAWPEAWHFVRSLKSCVALDEWTSEMT